MNDYERKQEERRERLEAAAARARGEAAGSFARARGIHDGIPMGQPILVGHHSEKRHRRDLERADNAMRSGIEASDRAADLASRASAVGTGGVSSDDPAAVAKLRAELAPLVALQDRMKVANKIVRRKATAEARIAALVSECKFTPAQAAKLLEPDFAGRLGFADYQTKNNGANIRRIEKRIAELEALATRKSLGSITGEGFRLVDEVDANRVRIYFDAIPAESVRDDLKGHGFRWTPSEGCWQRMASVGAWYHATRILGVTP